MSFSKNVDLAFSAGQKDLASWALPILSHKCIDDYLKQTTNLIAFHNLLSVTELLQLSL